MKIRNDLLNEVRVMLLASCHAPGCRRISKCPRQCGCRSKRTFALNTETAFCWEIADEILRVIKMKRPRKQDLRDLVIITRAYSDITRFHMTKGWQRFFWNLFLCIEAITNTKGEIWWASENEEIIETLKKSLKRLKRYPR